MHSLEQQLIEANMEIANVRSQVEIEQGLVNKLRIEKHALESTNETFGEVLDSNAIKETKGSKFLAMFKFKKAETTPLNPSVTQVDNSFMGEQSIDYANYLLQILGQKETLSEAASGRNLLNNVSADVVDLRTVNISG